MTTVIAQPAKRGRPRKDDRPAEALAAPSPSIPSAVPIQTATPAELVVRPSDDAGNASSRAGMVGYLKQLGIRTIPGEPFSTVLEKFQKAVQPR